MSGAISKIEPNTYANGKTLWEALFAFGNPELIAAYNNSSFDTNKARNVAKNAKSLGEGLLQATQAIIDMQALQGNKAKIIQNLKVDILKLIRKGDLIALGYQEPRNIQDLPIQIPADLFISGELNWDNSELIYKNIEITAIRIIKDLNPPIDVLIHSSNDSGEINKIENKNKLKKLNFSILESDRYINEKQASEFLGVAVKTLQGYRVKGGGPEFRKFGKSVRYKFNDLKLWAESARKNNTSQI